MAATDEDRATATRELNDYIDNQTADRLDSEVKATQDANQRKIDDLIQSFNNGTIGAQQFAADLNAIIGQDFGDSLGIAFVAGFKGAIANLVAEVQSIQSGGAGVQAPAGTGVAAAQSGVQQDKQDKYAQAVRKYRADRAERLKRAEDARRTEASRAGRRIDPGERAEIQEIMRLYDEKNKPPKREGVCDRCNSPLFVREDDRPETIRERIRIFWETTAPVIEYYAKTSTLQRVDASHGPESTYTAICS
jgi:hypothetical protein